MIIILIIYEIPTPGLAENKSRAKKKQSCQKKTVVPKKKSRAPPKNVVPKKNSRAEKKQSCRVKKVVPEKTDVVKTKLDEKNIGGTNWAP